MSHERPNLAHLLIQADSCEIGISVVTNNPKLLRAQLYAERKNLGLSHLAFVQPPVDPDTRIWIIKKDAKNGSHED